MENKLYVIYVGVAAVREIDIEEYVRKVTSRITPESIKGEVLIIPTQTYDSRVECVDPKYVTEPELIQKHTELMKELHDELAHQIENIKKENEKD